MFSVAVRRDALDSLRRRLWAPGSPLTAGSEAATELLRQADSVLDDVAITVTGTAGPAAARRAAEPGEQVLSPAESLRAATAVFEVLLPVVTTTLRSRDADKRALEAGTTSLNESVLRRFGPRAMSYPSMLLTTVDRDERHWVARELQDQAAQAIGVALRDLEPPDARIGPARVALHEALSVIRHLAQELRESPSDAAGLERALSDYLTWRVPPEVRTKLSVDNEIDLPNEVCEELYFVLREAIRNAVVHARAQNLAVWISLVGEEIHAVVSDDGCGFDADTDAAPTSSAGGLSSMRERLELLAGTLQVTSARDKGTTVLIRIVRQKQAS